MMLCWFVLGYLCVGFLIAIMAIPTLNQDDFVEIYKNDLDQDDVKEYNALKDKWDKSPMLTFCRVVFIYPLFLCVWIISSLLKKIFKKGK